MAKQKGKDIKPQTALALTPEYIDTMKFRDWTKYFLDIKNPETYGNATKSALRVYNTENYSSAGVIGHENLKKLKNMSVIVTDQLGYGFADLMKIGLAKMMKGQYDDWDRMMVRLGYFEPEKKIGSIVQNNFDFSNLGAAIARDSKERGLQP